MKRMKFDVSLRNQERADEENEGETVARNTTRAVYPKGGVNHFRGIDMKLERDVYRAAQYGDHEELAKILSSKKSERAETFGQESESFKLVFYFASPLHIAVQGGHSKCVQILIDHGVEVNYGDKYHHRPLEYAAMYDKYQCLKILLEAGADYSIPVIGNFRGTTVLHLSAKNNYIKCVEELIRFGANCSAVDERGCTSLYLAVESQLKECVFAHLRNAHDTSFINIPNTRNITPLHLAVERGMIECVQELVLLGADVNFRNGQNMSPLHLACCCSELHVDAKIQILKILVLDGHNTDVSNALHTSYFGGYDEEVTKLLIAYGANIDVRHERNGLVLFEKLINWTSESEILKYCMNCMPRLPLLHSLNIPLDFYATLPEKFLVYNYPVLSERADLRLARNERNIYVEITDSNPVKKYALLQQPLFDNVYDHVNRELKALSSNPTNQSVSLSVTEFLRRQYLLRLQNYLWYQKTASSPRTLQHHCRFSIRKCMGPTNIKHVKKLLLPRKLKSYLLFECDALLK